MSFLQEARDELSNRLRDGKTVNRLSLRDLVVADLSGPRCEMAAMEVSAIVVSEYPDTPLLQSRYVERLINEWLDKNEDAVAELAAEFRQDYMERQAA